MNGINSESGHGNSLQGGHRSDVVGVVVAAGLSTRMGRQKLLIGLDGVPLARRVVDAALGSRLRRVIVVTGPEATGVANAIPHQIGGKRLTKVVNPRPTDGMSSSMRIGLKEVEDSASGVMIILADQPGLNVAVIDRLLDSFAENPDRIVAAGIDGRRTTPVIFPSGLLPELMEVRGDRGGREVVNKHRSRIVLVECADVYDDVDIDVPEDVERIRAALEAGREEA